MSLSDDECINPQFRRHLAYNLAERVRDIFDCGESPPDQMDWDSWLGWALSNFQLNGPDGTEFRPCAYCGAPEFLEYASQQWRHIGQCPNRDPE